MRFVHEKNFIRLKPIRYVIEGIYVFEWYDKKKNKLCTACHPSKGLHHTKTY